jgi:hypothetical protein
VDARPGRATLHHVRDVDGALLRHEGVLDHQVVAAGGHHAVDVPGVVDHHVLDRQREEAQRLGALEPLDQTPHDRPAGVHGTGAPLPATGEAEAAGLAAGVPPGGVDHGGRQHVAALAVELALEGLGELAEHPVVLDAEGRDPGQRGVGLGQREPDLHEVVEVELEPAVAARHHHAEQVRLLERPDRGVGGSAQPLGLGRLGRQVRHQVAHALAQAGAVGARIHAGDLRSGDGRRGGDRVAWSVPDAHVRAQLPLQRPDPGGVPRAHVRAARHLPAPGVTTLTH